MLKKPPYRWVLNIRTNGECSLPKLEFGNELKRAISSIQCNLPYFFHAMMAYNARGQVTP